MAYRRDGKCDDERDPHTGGNGLGMRRFDVDRRRASVNTAPITDTPAMSPRMRDRLSMPEMTPAGPADVCHDSSAVGRLERRIADGDDDDGGDVAGDAERRRQHG